MRLIVVVVATEKGATGTGVRDPGALGGGGGLGGVGSAQHDGVRRDEKKDERHGEQVTMGAAHHGAENVVCWESGTSERGGASTLALRNARCFKAACLTIHAVQLYTRYSCPRRTQCTAEHAAHAHARTRPRSAAATAASAQVELDVV